MRIFTVFFILFFLATGCAKRSTLTYTPMEFFPVSQQYVLNNYIELNASPDAAWLATLRVLEKEGWRIQNSNEEDRLLIISLTLQSPSEFMNCGTRVRVLEEIGVGGKILEVYKDDSISQIDWLLTKSEQSSYILNVLVNLQFEEATTGTTKTIVTAEYDAYISRLERSRNMTYVEETTYTYYTEKVGNQWITTSVPHTKRTPKYEDGGLQMSTTNYKANTYYKEGEQCHSTQKLEQIILQRIKEELLPKS